MRSRTTRPVEPAVSRAAAHRTEPTASGPVAADHRPEARARLALDRTIQESPRLAVQRRSPVLVGPRTSPVQRVLSPSSDDPADWQNLTDGQTGAGVTGVVIAVKNGDEVVVKGLEEPPQRAMLAQEMMKKVGVATLETRPVAVASAFGRHILDSLESLAGLLTGNGQPHGAAILQKVQAWRGGATLLLMKKGDVKHLQQLVTAGPDVGGMAALPQEAQDRYGGDPHQIFWRDLLNNTQVWSSFGKMFWVDQFLGNEDRFESLKVQNVFVDSADNVVALDNDAMMPAYFHTHTTVDRTMGVEMREVDHSTPTDYVRNVVEGGQVLGSTRAMASLHQISGDAAELRAKVNAKVDALLALLHASTVGADANKQAAHAEVGALIADSAAVKAAMYRGADHARQTVMGMFQTRLGKSPIEKLREAQKSSAGRTNKVGDKVLYSRLALAIRHDYLVRRAAGVDHGAALTAVEDRFRRDILRAGAEGRTTRSLDAQELQQEDFMVL